MKVNFFHCLYCSSFLNSNPLLSGDTISDYIRAILQSIEHRGNIPSLAGGWSFGGAFNGLYGLWLRVGSFHDDCKGTPSTLDTNVLYMSDEDMESSLYSLDHSSGLD